MTSEPRRIDHLVVAVADLDAAGAFYERLGFTVGARNRHPWGTENRLIQFDRSFIELITLAADADGVPDHEPGRFSFGAFVRDYLHAREGMAMLALGSDDARADAARYSRQGIGSFEPFYFERSGRRPDGSETRVAFTLAFAADPGSPEAGFFVCQQHFPENFWNPAFQRHPNGATGITGVGMVAASPRDHAGFLAAFSGAAVQSGPEGSLTIALSGARLVVVPETEGRGDLRFASFTVRIADVEAQADRLAGAGVPFAAGRGSLRIPAEAAHGVAIHFERAGTTTA